MVTSEYISCSPLVFHSAYLSVLFGFFVLHMGSMANPKAWVPYMNTKDCSQGFCSLYCPQWCYIIFPPPPSFFLPDDDDPGPSFSPIGIAIIGILASAFLLVSYFAIISKYCKDTETLARRRENNEFPFVESEENQDHSNREAWRNPETGLDEALIKSIKVLKYKKGDGLIEGTDCSVCLSEFQDDESLRLLPKCSHAFHVICIDTWLRSHSNCPLCRANIAFANAFPTAHLPPLMENRPQNDPSSQGHPEIENAAPEDDLEMAIRGGKSRDGITTSPGREASDMGTSSYRSVGDGGNDEGGGIRRSVSMDDICQRRLSIADAVRINQDDEDDQMEESKSRNDVGTSKWRSVGLSRPSNVSRVLHCASSPIVKRSLSSGRFLLSKGRRGMHFEIPL